MKCGQAKCEADATHRFHWTDGWHECCEACAAKAMKIGEAVGLHVSVELLEPSRN